MRLNNLKLKYYRSHKNYSADFDKNLIVINGPNGAGKTNLLEAIYMLATAKSNKASYDRDLINYESDFCTIAGNISTEYDEIDLELQIAKSEKFEHAATKKTKVNKVAKSISSFTGRFNAVLFSPEDMSIISGTPAERRRFLDLILFQTSQSYKKSHSEYTKAIRQRNKLLELINETGQGKNQIEFWTDKIVELGTFIQDEREKFFTHARLYFSETVKELNNNQINGEIIYKKSEITAPRIQDYKEREVAAKTTLIGPHRDDFLINFNNHNVAEFGSRGQQRTILLSLKLIEIDFIEKIKGERPVLLLDDIFSELDENHREAVIATVSKQQTFISSAENIQHLLPDHSQLITF